MVGINFNAAPSGTKRQFCRISSAMQSHAQLHGNSLIWQAILKLVSFAYFGGDHPDGSLTVPLLIPHSFLHHWHMCACSLESSG